MPNMSKIMKELRESKDYRTIALIEINNRLVQINNTLKDIVKWIRYKS